MSLKRKVTVPTGSSATRRCYDAGDLEEIELDRGLRGDEHGLRLGRLWLDEQAAEQLGQPGEVLLQHLQHRRRVERGRRMVERVERQLHRAEGDLLLLA